MSSDFEQNMMNHIMEINATSKATAQSLSELRDGLKVVIPDLSERVGKAETKQNWIMGVGTGLSFAFTSFLGWMGLHGLHK
jgi:hypothetical protein